MRRRWSKLQPLPCETPHNNENSHITYMKNPYPTASYNVSYALCPCCMNASTLRCSMIHEQACRVDRANLAAAAFHLEANTGWTEGSTYIGKLSSRPGLISFLRFPLLFFLCGEVLLWDGPDVPLDLERQIYIILIRKHADNRQTFDSPASAMK